MSSVLVLVFILGDRFVGPDGSLHYCSQRWPSREVKPVAYFSNCGPKPAIEMDGNWPENDA